MHVSKIKLRVYRKSVWNFESKERRGVVRVQRHAVQHLLSRYVVVRCMNMAWNVEVLALEESLYALVTRNYCSILNHTHKKRKQRNTWNDTALTIPRFRSLEPQDEDEYGKRDTLFYSYLSTSHCEQLHLVWPAPNRLPPHGPSGLTLVLNYVCCIKITANTARHRYKTIWLIPLREIFGVYFENKTKHIWIYRLYVKLQSFLLSHFLSFETVHLFWHCVALDSFLICSSAF